MKVLIWIGCLFLHSLITTTFSYNGIILGGLPTIAIGALMFALARALCNAWDNREQPDPAPVPPQIDLPDPASVDPTPIHDEPPAPSRVRYCKLCGSPVDPETRKCTGCSKQYFPSPAFLRAAPVALAITLTAGSVIFLLVQNTQYRQALSDSREQIDALSDTVTAYETQIDALTVTTSELEAELKAEAKNSDNRFQEVMRLKSELSVQEQAVSNMRDEVLFYRDHVAIVLDRGPLSYHTYRCPLFHNRIGDYMIYSHSDVVSLGYRPCTLCHD